MGMGNKEQSGVSRKISAASARAHTRIPKQSTPFQLPSGFYFFGQIDEMKYMMLDTSSVDFVFQMLVDDIGDVTITNDGAIILKMLDVEHPAAKVEEYSIRLAELQDREVGNGTTSVVIMRIFLPRMPTPWNIYLIVLLAQKMSMSRERKLLRFDLLLGKFQRQENC
ncbi:T-complex protein 1 subunit alpha [Camellia lanceoleosa]|uniref:T-complex protein 1 subunit alpha n=1 Tax=Camellia lanceoleosa TaxID=1840588 RepID=A0ACC0ILD9_9ERIC|nr:T-complex protein 1 subunit alpha [Camellia lanceoleosa]